MNVDYEAIVRQGGQRVAVKDLQMLERCVDSMPTRVIVEIGAAGGCSSIVLGLAAKRHGAHVWSVEPWPTARWHENIARYDLADTMTLVEGESPWVDPRQVAGEIDLLFIDGDHRSPWIVADFRAWEPFVRIGGVIAFHDWNGKRGIWRWIRDAVEMIRAFYPLTEIDRSDARGYGAIAFRKNGPAPPFQQFPDPAAWPAEPPRER